MTIFPISLGQVLSGVHRESLTLGEAIGGFGIGPVWHGTSHNFNSFELKGGVVTTCLSSERVDRHAVFFAKDREFAGEFGPKILCAYLNIRHLLDMVEPQQADFDRLVQAGISESWLNHCYSYDTWEMFDGDDGRVFVKALRQAGFDGVMFSESGHDVYAVLDPGQIRIVGVERGTDANESSESLTLGRVLREANVAKTGGSFACGACGHADDADVNAARNIALDLPPVSAAKRRKQPSRKGFYWGAPGGEAIVLHVQQANKRNRFP